MPHEVLTPQEMAEVDRLAIADGPFSGFQLMRNAGAAVVAVLLRRYPQAVHVHVLCGPGNNGGDGYVVANILATSGKEVSVWAEGRPRHGSDAALALADCCISPQPLSGFRPEHGSVVVDALYGAGLSKPLSADGAGAIEAIANLDVPVISVDLPSGISGESGLPLGASFRAAVTVTFVRKKPGHLLLPGREACGEIVVADIGIGQATIAAVKPRSFENQPALWRHYFCAPAVDTHKYRRGHVGVFSGGPASTGAARLAAMAAARAGAGAVTVLSPANALAANAAHLTSIILRRSDSLEGALEFVADRKPDALVFGPGLGPQAETGRFLLDLIEKLGQRRPRGIIVDADALTSLARQPAALFTAARKEGAPSLVLTPHDGEFTRLFPDIADDAETSKLSKARAAAERANAVVIYKGADTVIASPDGRAAINSNGTPLLATAGSGDVLAGIVAALLAQAMPPFEAGCAAVWLHAEAARRFGPGLIAEDLPLALLPVLRELLAAGGDVIEDGDIRRPGRDAGGVRVGPESSSICT